MSGTLYKLFNTDGDCLYVGASISPAARLSQHAEKPWWGEVTTATFEHFPTRDEAIAAEAAELAANPPRHNVVVPGRQLSEAELADRRERRAARQREAEEKQARKAHIPGLHCTNCSWKVGVIEKGRLLDETPCPRCGCLTLSVAEEAVA